MRTGKPQTFYLSNQVMEGIDRKRGMISRSSIVNGILKDALECQSIGDPEDE
jgi:hypothetical protein